MKMRSDYTNSPVYLRNFGPDKLHEAQEAAAATTTPPCPFCGTEAVFLLGNLWGKNYAAIQCPCCGVCTDKVFMGFNQITGETLTVSDVFARLAEVWSRRPTKT